MTLPIPIPPVVINVVVAWSPLLIAVIGAIMEISDYFFSSSFFKASKLFQTDDNVFDFIVVGGGSAGSVVASRLVSRNPKLRLLLLEAGGDPHPLSYLPAATPLLLNQASTDWQYKTVRQNGSAFGMESREVVWPRGKSLGGSSNANFMIYMTGNPRDYDRWAEHSGDDRWSYENLKTYFQRIEDYHGTWDDGDFHGKGGPQRVEPVSYRPGLKYVLQAAQELGYDIRDLNRDHQQGFSPMDFTAKRGFRFSTYRGYIFDSLLRLNLEIRRYSLATKINFDNQLRAVGVTYLRHGVKQYASAKREIIICAGSINTPQLLMLSGLGPRQHLHSLGIAPLVNLPVGNNLQDHVTTIVGPFLLNQSESLMINRDVTVGAILDYIKSGTGPLSTPFALTGVGLVSTSEASPDWPNIIYTLGASGLSDVVPRVLDEMFRAGTLAQRYTAEVMGSDSHVVLVSAGLPKSRGFIRLRDTNPMSKPLIDPRYYSDPEGHDIRAMVEGVEIIVKLFENTASMRRLNAHLPDKPMPGCEQFEMRSKAYFECLVRTVTITLFHPTSTCSMGKPGHPDAVVDSELRVFGVRGLRVADASIMPFVTNANTNAPTIVIGEMCADLIQAAWEIT